MPRNKEENDFELNYISREKTNYNSMKQNLKKPIPPPRKSLENLATASGRASPLRPSSRVGRDDQVLANAIYTGTPVPQYVEPESYCEPRDQVMTNLMQYI